MMKDRHPCEIECGLKKEFFKSGNVERKGIMALLQSGNPVGETALRGLQETSHAPHPLTISMPTSTLLLGREFSLSRKITRRGQPGQSLDRKCTS